MKYSIIVPVFNRPDEVEELLESLTTQTMNDFEVVVVEDGSQKPCEHICKKYESRLSLKYFMKPNSGPGQSRNYGAERADGQYLLILDSDVMLPPTYLEEIEKELKRQPADAFGGPDATHPSFTPMQKAIGYTMTSFFTTGGIRGGKKKLDKFFPRSFNMGIRRDIYQQLGGFSKMRFGEDIDFSYRIVEAGCQTRLFPKAWVWHKRRTDLKKFFRQVYNSGIARINLTLRHPGTLKAVHLLPAVFTVGVCALIVISAVGRAMMHFDADNATCWKWVFLLPWAPILLYALLIFTDAARHNGLGVAVRSVPAAFTQLMGYGFGFLEAWWKRIVRHQDEFTAFEKNFYK